MRERLGKRHAATRPRRLVDQSAQQWKEQVWRELHDQIEHTQPIPGERSERRIPQVEHHGAIPPFRRLPKQEAADRSVPTNPSRTSQKRCRGDRLAQEGVDQPIRAHGLGDTDQRAISAIGNQPGERLQIEPIAEVEHGGIENFRVGSGSLAVGEASKAPRGRAPHVDGQPAGLQVLRSRERDQRVGLRRNVPGPDPLRDQALLDSALGVQTLPQGTGEPVVQDRLASQIQRRTDQVDQNVKTVV